MKTPISPKISLERLRHVAAQQFDIRIASDGRWFHEGDEIRRLSWSNYLPQFWFLMIR